MEVHYYKTYSNNLHRDMEYKTYGNAGRGVLVFPSQDQRFYEWEDNGMISVLAPMIEAGEFHLICCDSIDKETWSIFEHANVNDNDNKAARSERYQGLIELHERWFNYIVDELIPSVNNGEKLIVTGCSMGGYHAGNVFFRRPDLFDTLLSLSGLFHADYFFPEFNNELIYNNSPLHFLNEKTDPSILLNAYREKEIILCCGQGYYEDITCPSTQRLGTLLAEKNIPAWVDIWGNDVNHDFEWWRKQAVYFFNYLIKEKKQVA